jgi:coenzyme F420-reducing hydrogenase gamma subunit
VWKFASCDGCQLEVLSLADRLLTLTERIDVAFFLEASGRRADGPYDLSLVEGSITTPDDARRIREIRAQSKTLVTIGACATSGGIQALRNFAEVEAFTSIVYARPDYIDTLAESTGIADHVTVDFELRGCPISIALLTEVVTAFLDGRRPSVPPSSVCGECKRRGTVCVMVAHGTPCLGPITQAGCGALCPAYDRGCYGCFGPAETANAAALMDWWGDVLGVDAGSRVRMLRTFNANAPEFRDESRRQDEQVDHDAS